MADQDHRAEQPCPGHQSLGGADQLVAAAVVDAELAGAVFARHLADGRGDTERSQGPREEIIEDREPPADRGQLGGVGADVVDAQRAAMVGHRTPNGTSPNRYELVRTGRGRRPADARSRGVRPLNATVGRGR